MNAADLATREDGKLQEYVSLLKIWRQFMLVDSNEPWDPEVARDIRPHHEETENQWLDRCWELFEPMEEFPIVVLNSPEEAVADWDGGFEEIHLRVDITHFTKAEILQAVESLLDNRMPEKSKRRNPRTHIRQRAFYQPNASSDVRIDRLEVILRVLRLYREAKMTLTEIGDVVFPPGTEAVKQRVFDCKTDGEELVRAVRHGIFPNPNRRANGQI